MEVFVNLQSTLDVKVGIQPVLNDEALIFALIWFKQNSHSLHSKTPGGINFYSRDCLGMSIVFTSSNAKGSFSPFRLRSACHAAILR
jgi:hypothetical protein